MSQTSINVPSSEEISFKLSQNLLSSMQISKTIMMPIQSSLQYTNSRISIQEHIQLTHQFPVFFKKIDEYSTMKDFSQKTTCINSSAQHSLKSSVRNVSRPRSFSIKKVSAKPLFNLFADHKKIETSRGQSIKNNMINNRFTKRSKRISYHQQKQQLLINSQLNNHNYTSNKQNSIYNLPEQFNLKKSFIIKQIELKSDSQKYRNYLRKIVQNRGTNIHLDELDNIQTSRKSSQNCRFSKKY